MTTSINDSELILTRIVPATPDVVFEAWTDPAHLSHWWGPEGFATTTRSMDLRPGGRWRFTMHGPDGRDYENEVEFLEVVRPSLVSYRHRDVGEAEPVRFDATVTFAGLGSRTLLTMRMVFEGPADLARVEDAYGASAGQRETIERFTRHLEAQGVESGEGQG